MHDFAAGCKGKIRKEPSRSSFLIKRFPFVRTLFLQEPAFPPGGVVAPGPVVMLVHVEHAAVLRVGVDLPPVQKLAEAVGLAIGLQMAGGKQVPADEGECADENAALRKLLHPRGNVCICAEQIVLSLIGDALIVHQVIADKADKAVFQPVGGHIHVNHFGGCLAGVYGARGRKGGPQLKLLCGDCFRKARDGPCRGVSLRQVGGAAARKEHVGANDEGFLGETRPAVEGTFHQNHGAQAVGKIAKPPAAGGEDVVFVSCDLPASFGGNFVEAVFRAGTGPVPGKEQGKHKRQSPYRTAFHGMTSFLERVFCLIRRNKRENVPAMRSGDGCNLGRTC